MLPSRIKRTELTATRAALVALQGGRCAVCERKFSTKVVACVDHDHKLGHIRGALCRACNRLEGQLGNRVVMAGGTGMESQMLRNLADYWDKYSKGHPTMGVVWHPDHKTENEKRLERNRKAREKRAKLKG